RLDLPVSSQHEDVRSSPTLLTVSRHGNPVCQYRALAMPNVTASAQVHARHEALGGANMRNQIADAVDETVAVAEPEIRSGDIRQCALAHLCIRLGPDRKPRVDSRGG